MGKIVPSIVETATIEMLPDPSLRPVLVEQLQVWTCFPSISCVHICNNSRERVNFYAGEEITSYFISLLNKKKKKIDPS